MNAADFFNYILFTIGDYTIHLGQLIGAIIFLLFLFLLYRLLMKKWLPPYLEREDIKPDHKAHIYSLIKYAVYLIAFIFLILIFKLNYTLFDNYSFNVVMIIGAMLIFQLARLSDALIAKVFLHNYYTKRDEQQATGKKKTTDEETEDKASNIVKYVVYVISLLLILRVFNLDYELFSFPHGDHIFHFNISNILIAILVLLVARLIVWVLVNLVLYGYYKRNNISVGPQYAVNQLLKYVIYVIAFFIAIDNLGIDMTLVWGGAAALLVGIGLGLQQTFNDLVSGIILLFERTVEVGDIVDINGLVGSVKKIGLRTSIVETRDNITVVVPNSKLIVDNVVNWSHFDNKARFHINVGVAYGSDTKQVKEILLQVAKDNIYVLKYPYPFVRFVDFGESSLDFQLHFWTRNFVVIEDIKSDIRFEIDNKFRENEIEIPFPQRDVWSRTKGQ